MIKQLLALLVFFSILVSCRCPDDVDDNFIFTDFERSIISFTADTTVGFVDQNDSLFQAQYSVLQSEIINMSSAEQCFAENIEEQSITLQFNDRIEMYEIVLNKNTNNDTKFRIESIQGNYVIDSCDGIITTIENQVVNITIQKFEYNSVFEFKACNDESRIIYSRERGIEFIEFDENTFLRRQ